jgi:hypothetical protein
MYEVNNNEVPDYLVDLFTKTSSSHGYETRQAEFNFVPPKPNTNFCKKSFSYRGAVAWNKLPTNVKSLDSYTTFKRNLVPNNFV